MLKSETQRAQPTARTIAFHPLQRAFLTLAGGMFAALATGLVLIFGVTGAAFGALSVFAALVAVAAYMVPGYHPHPALGSANTVTLGRGALAAFVVAAVFAPDTAVWLVFGVAVTAFALDGVDGYLARRERLSSAFGARFDMEVDAILAATLSLIALSAGKVGPEVLVLGFARYTFVAASSIWPWLNGSLPESMRRKTVCVIQIAALIFLLFPLAPAMWLMPVSVFAALALVWSFAVDIRWLKKAAD